MSLVSYDNAISRWPLQSMGRQSFWMGCNDGSGVWTGHAHPLQVCHGPYSTPGHTENPKLPECPHILSGEESGGLPGRPDAEGVAPMRSCSETQLGGRQEGLPPGRQGCVWKERWLVAQASERGRL